MATCSLTWGVHVAIHRFPARGPSDGDRPLDSKRSGDLRQESQLFRRERIWLVPNHVPCIRPSPLSVVCFLALQCSTRGLPWNLTSPSLLYSKPQRRRRRPRRRSQCSSRITSGGSPIISRWTGRQADGRPTPHTLVTARPCGHGLRTRVAGTSLLTLSSSTDDDHHAPILPSCRMRLETKGTKVQ